MLLLEPYFVDEKVRGREKEWKEKVDGDCTGSLGASVSKTKFSFCWKK